MTEIKVEAVSPKNVDDVLKIEVWDDQIDFVPSVESSIELARKYEDACCCAVRVGGTVCGFGLYGIDEETGNWKIYRLVIDRRFQGRGIGKEALGQILDILRNGHEAREVLIVYASDNRTAHRLYSGFGFVPYGSREDRILSKLTLADGKLPAGHASRAVQAASEEGMSAGAWAYFEPSERACVERFADLLRERVAGQLHEVWLFGSFARGDMWSSRFPVNSDIDLLVLTPEPLSTELQDDLVNETYPLYLECGRQISPQFRSIAQFENPETAVGLEFRRQVHAEASASFLDEDWMAAAEHGTAAAGRSHGPRDVVA